VDVAGLKATVVDVEAPAAWLAGGRIRTVRLACPPIRSRSAIASCSTVAW
jgi:hypothetical protein